VSATKEGLTQELGGRGLTREQEAAAAIRSATITREELQLKYPELNKAVFQHLASHDQFAEAYIKSGLIRESDAHRSSHKCAIGWQPSLSKARLFANPTIKR